MARFPGAASRPAAGAVLAGLLLVSAPVRASLPTGGEEPVRPGHPAPAQIKERGRYSFEPSTKRTDSLIRFANGIEFDTQTGEPSLPRELRSRAEAAPGERISRIVQVAGPARDEWVRQLVAAGALVETFLPNYAFLVRLDARDLSAIEALPFVTWTGAYHPAYRISGQPEMMLRSGEGEFQVLLFDDGDLGSVEELVRFTGGRITERSDNGINRMLTVTAPRADVAALASHPDVQWIEPRPVFTTDNSSVQWVDQTNINGNRKIWDQGIDGTGQVVMVGDSGIRTSHNMFRDGAVSITNFGSYPTHRKIISYDRGLQSTNVSFGDTAGASYHGSHTSCTFAGDDAPWGSSALDGMAKGARIYFVDCGGSDNSIYSPGDLNEYFGPSYIGNAGGAARVSSNSWGASTGGAYTISCMTTDQFMWDHKDYLICFSNGNSGTSGSVGSPGAAKNILSSGGTRNGTSANLIYTSTSRGPTQDGRYKPTVCSPGQSVQSASGSSDTAYQTLSGTSMSCPNLAGSATLARQYFADGWYPTGAPVPANAFEPSAALLKAMMVNSGVDDFSSYGIPDNNIGWGRILLDNVMYFPGDARATVIVDEADGVATGEAREYEFQVTSTSQDLKVTLVWTDVASTPAAATNLVNDLDLVVTHSGSTYRGNVWSGGQSVTGGSADAVNVEENVRRAVPTTGTWVVRVEGANVPFGPQPYALVVSGGVGGSAGLVKLDAASYGPTESMGVRVEDTGGGGTVSVTVSSTTEAGGETFVIAGGNGVYEGSVPLTLAAVSGSDGQLSVGQGDVITVSYSDPSPAHTAQATATVDVDDPEVTGVSTSAKDTRATVFWSTDGAATSQIEYGTTPALGSLSAFDPSLVTGHAHEVNGLTAETTYYFDILSEDHAGNLVRDDFGGIHYRFTTGRRADVLLVEADPNTTENLSRYDTAFAATGWTFDRWGKQEADAALVGNSSEGLRSYNAVWWQVGWEQYPCFLNEQRDSLLAYHDGGARLAMVSHDVAWSFSDGSSGFWGPAKVQWYQDITHSSYDADPLTYSSIVGIAADPISGGKTGGMSYTPHRDGAAGDELTKIDGTGTASYAWRNNDTSPDDVSVRWQSGGNLGTPGVGVWGGQPTRTVFMAWEFLNLNSAADRADVLDNTVKWLIGGDHPDAAVVSPNGGNVFTTSPVSISWTASTDTGAGRNLGAVRLEYSDDSGMSWNLITASPGSSPYSWNVSALPTDTNYRVRVVVEDDGTPALAFADASNADFTIAIPGNETVGPIVVAGSPSVDAVPIDVGSPANLAATVTDAFTGGSNVVAAEWSAGVSPAPAGSGAPMTGAFGTVEVAVSAALDTNALPLGATTVWVRAQDAAGNWGGATALAVQVNGSANDVAIGGEVAELALAQNFPNPFRADTRIRFALPQAERVDLRVFDVGGRAVRTLVRDELGAGVHNVAWDGRDDDGNRVASGVYFYRMTAGAEERERKMVHLK